MAYIDSINNPKQLKKLSIKQLYTCAEELRALISKTVTSNGGHLASNLGVCELTLALHYVFDAPTDKIVWDVGHQTYAHKILTGRRDKFYSLRTQSGITGFPCPEESECDLFTTGHSSNSISLAEGLAHARDLKKDNYNIVAIVGDGAFTGGMIYEALNDIGANQTRIIIVLNDNKMAIARNVGAMSQYFARLRLNKRYCSLKLSIKSGVEGLPFLGGICLRVMRRTKDAIKNVVLSNKLFDILGVKYYGAYDGHNIAQLVSIFEEAKNKTGPILIHVTTEKGYGNEQALVNPEKYHGVNPEHANKTKSFSACVGKILSSLAAEDERVVAITAAMSKGTGLDDFISHFPHRYFDVAIAEQHAVSLASGMAKGGLKPYFAVYSTFLQRAFDQILQDVCLNDLPVTLLIDRSGLVGADGVTHHGLFEFSYLGMMPNMSVCCPKDEYEFIKLMQWSLNYDHPLAICYPKDYFSIYDGCADIALGKWEWLRKNGNSACIVATGARMLDIACAVEHADVVNARFIKPLDKEMLHEIAVNYKLLITMEDNVLSGGFGQSVLYELSGSSCKIVILSHGDKFVYDLDCNSAYQAVGMTAENINNLICKYK